MAERFSLEALRYAQAVAETGSFSAAARACGVTQPALSNGIARLEERLGDRLFDRSTRGVRPTPFGERLLPLVESAVAALDDLSAEALRATSPDVATVRVGVSPIVNPRVVADAYRVACCGPGMSAHRELVLREANMADLRADLAAGELDVILIPSVGPLPRFQHRIIDSEPVVVVQAQPAGDGPVDLEELADKPLLLVPDTCGLTTFTTQLFGAHGLPVRRYPGEASSYLVLDEWARLGLGVSILPESRLADPHSSSRPLSDGGEEVEIFYEAVWDPRSVLANDLLSLAETLAARPHN